MVFQCGQQVTPRSPKIDWAACTDACKLEPSASLPVYGKVYTILRIYAGEHFLVSHKAIAVFHTTFLNLDTCDALCDCGKAKGWFAACFRPVRSVERGMERLRGLLLPTAPSLVPEIEKRRQKEKT